MKFFIETIVIEETLNFTKALSAFGACNDRSNKIRFLLLFFGLHTYILNDYNFLDHYETTVASNELILRTTSFQVYQDPVPLRILYQVKAN